MIYLFHKLLKSAKYQSTSMKEKENDLFPLAFAKRFPRTLK